MTKSFGNKIRSLTSKLQRETSGQAHSVGAMYAIIFMIVLVFIAVVLFTFIPGMGSTIATAVPAPPAYGKTGGEWNATDSANPNQAALAASSGVSIWVSSSGMFKIAIIIVILALVIAALLGMLQMRRTGGSEGGPM